MINKALAQRLKLYEEEFRNFMKIKDFPEYQIKTKEVSINVSDSCGFESAASASYVIETKTHTLTVSTNLEVSKDLIFHEFTHILDSEMYSKDDKIRYAGISGFTEYHASQVELAYLLGANTIDDIPSFSMDTIISTFVGEKSVYQYVDEKQQHAIDLFARTDFPANISALKSAVGVLCNYYGLRSICEKYSIDYTEKVDNAVFLQYISTQYFSKFNSFMHGWLDEDNIELSIPLYINIITSILRN